MLCLSHRLIPMPSHLAAPYRHSLSALAQMLINRNLLALGETHLDYGCGRGGDVERLRSRGYDSRGYDPHYFPESTAPADVVTMNYVLNVIEDATERRDALLNAWSLTQRSLLVAANVRGSGVQSRHEGTVSSRGVWTKAYSHLELKAYLETVLGVRVEKLAKDKFLVSRSAPSVRIYSREQVLALGDRLQTEGFIAPLRCVLHGYCTGFQTAAGLRDTKMVQNYGRWAGSQRYYRLKSNDFNLPGANGQLVKVIHLGYYGTEKFEWAIAAIRRRNLLARAQFHCQDLSFLPNFEGIKSFEFLVNNEAGVMLDDEAQPRHQAIRYAVPDTVDNRLRKAESKLP
jgi:hypothetical protein